MSREQSRATKELQESPTVDGLAAWMLKQKGLEETPKNSTTTAPTGFGIEWIVCQRSLGMSDVINDLGESEICDVCFGVGGRMIRYQDERDRLCPSCAGMGRVVFPEADEAETCPRCHGRGLIQIMISIPVASPE